MPLRLKYANEIFYLGFLKNDLLHSLGKSTILSQTVQYSQWGHVNLQRTYKGAGLDVDAAVVVL